MNIIETTYVMRLDVLKRLQDAEIETKIPKEFLLVFCMQHMLADYKRYLRDTQRIEYQKRLKKIILKKFPCGGKI